MNNINIPKLEEKHNIKFIERTQGYKTYLEQSKALITLLQHKKALTYKDLAIIFGVKESTIKKRKEHYTEKLKNFGTYIEDYQYINGRKTRIFIFIKTEQKYVYKNKKSLKYNTQKAITKKALEDNNNNNCLQGTLRNIIKKLDITNKLIFEEYMELEKDIQILKTKLNIAKRDLINFKSNEELRLINLFNSSFNELNRNDFIHIKKGYYMRNYRPNNNTVIDIKETTEEKYNIYEKEKKKLLNKINPYAKNYYLLSPDEKELYNRKLSYITKRLLKCDYIYTYYNINILDKEEAFIFTDNINISDYKELLKKTRYKSYSNSFGEELENKKILYEECFN